MTDIERYLKDHMYAKRSIGRLMLDLGLAKSKYEQSYEHVGVSCNYKQVKTGERRQHVSPVEWSAVLIVDHFRAEVESIERRLSEERQKVEMIEQMVKSAVLDAQESEYVRLRYFEGRSVQAIAQRLYCSVATCGRIRERALGKLEKENRKTPWQEV